MSKPFRELTYGLEKYDRQATTNFLIRRSMPAPLRYPRIFFWGCLALLVLGFCVAAKAGFRTSGGHTYLVFGAVWLLFVIALRKRNALILAGLERAAIRSGTTKLSMTDEGLSVSDEGCRVLAMWSHIVDVIPGKDGLPVLRSPTSYIPIPASAFADAGEQDLFLKELRARVADAKGSIQ